MDEDKSERIGQARKEIDAIDAELIQLISRRAELAKHVGQIKGEDDVPVFVPERERQIYERLAAYQHDALTSEHLTSIFREIISASRSAEKPLQIAYWGPEGTFSHQAAVSAFGGSAQHVPVQNIRDVFLMVERKQADYGVVPIENSIGGVIPETLDMFGVTQVKICSETLVPIYHHLGSQADALSDIKRVFAGPQPAAQCSQWLRDHLPQALIVDVVPTAGAVKKALEDPESAAIANKVCLDLYGLPSVAEHIQDSSSNRTRFVVIGYNDPAPSGHDKTSLMFKLKNRRGELYRVLGCFVEHEVNLTLIESRPDPRSTFQYLFYLDCDGHRLDENVMRAINDLRSVASETVILGSYPSYQSESAQF